MRMVIVISNLLSLSALADTEPFCLKTEINSECLSATHAASFLVVQAAQPASVSCSKGHASLAEKYKVVPW